MQMGEKYTWKYLCRFQVWVDGKREKIICTPYSVLKYDCFEQRSAFGFFCNKVENKKVRQCAQSKGRKRTFGDSYCMFHVLYFPLFLKVNIMLTSDCLVKQK